MEEYLQKAAGSSLFGLVRLRESEIVVVVVDEDTCRCLLVMRMVGVVGSEDG